MKLSWLIGSCSSKTKVSKPLLYTLYAGAALSIGIVAVERFLRYQYSNIDSTPWTITKVISGDRLSVARHQQTQELQLCGVSTLGIQTQKFLQAVIEQGDGTVVWSEAGDRYEAWIVLEPGYDVDLFSQYSTKPDEYVGTSIHLNTWLIESGYARYSREGYQKCHQPENLVWAEELARESKLGIWSGK